MVVPYDTKTVRSDSLQLTRSEILPADIYIDPRVRSHPPPCTLLTRYSRYAQGPNKLLYTFPAGQWNRSKSASMEECARAELSEEAHLTGGEMIQLLPQGHEGVAELKW